MVRSFLRGENPAIGQSASLPSAYTSRYVPKPMMPGPHITAFSPIAQTCSDLNLRHRDLKLRCPHLTVRSADLKLRCPHLTVRSADLNVRCPHLTVRCPHLTVRSADLNVRCPHLTVRSADLNVRCPHLTVRSADLKLRCPHLTVRSADLKSEMSAPQREVGGSQIEMVLDSFRTRQGSGGSDLNHVMHRSLEPVSFQNRVSC